MTRSTILHRLVGVVQSILRERGAKTTVVTEQTSLVDDLGFDSLDFVDLTLDLEDALERDGFPMQAWADGQIEASGARFTVAALTDACVEFLRASGADESRV